MSLPEPVVEVRNLTKRFGRFTAVDHVSFSIHRGEILGFLGPNGAGKSTTIRMLCGLLRSSEGSATVAGSDINRDPDRVREQIGYMSQRFSLYRDLTVQENILFFGGVYGLREADLLHRLPGLLEMAGLTGMERLLTGELSGALQQRLALGCAIMHEPRVLFLDEPTSGIDPLSRRLFWDLIRDLAARGVTILVTTHFMDEAEFCGRIAFINAARLVALDTPTALKNSVVTDDVFEVSFEGRPSEVQQRLLALPGIHEVSHFGSRLHLFCEAGTLSPESLRQRAAQAGIPVTALLPVRPNLEDAFLRLVQKTTRENPAP
jgi:ABC-2 type transport system ATP-binding protein